MADLDSWNGASAPAHAERIHRELIERAHRTDPENVDATLCLLVAVLIHGLYEDVLFPGAAYAAPELRDGLAREHAELLETLDLMRELEESKHRADAVGVAAAADLATLCAAVRRRLVRHVARDARIIYGSLARLDAISAPKAPE